MIGGRAGRRPGLVLALWLPLGVALASAGCSATQAGPSRRDWLARTLLERHAAELRRDPPAVAEKLRRMSRSGFDYFRGSAALLPVAPTRFLTPAAATVAVLGDPHPENVGTFPGPGGQVVIDFNDFDLAGRGSYVADLRRLALGLWIAADQADRNKKQRVRLVEEVVEGYLEEVAALGQGRAPVRLRGDTFLDGQLAEVLAAPDGVGEQAEGRPAPEAAQVEPGAVAALTAALPAYRKTLPDPSTAPPAGWTVKELATAQAGVSSYPLRRYRLRLEGPGPGRDDDWLLELKESAADPAPLLALQRQMQEAPDLDPLLGWTTLEGRHFRGRQIGPAYRRLSVERLARAVKGPGLGKKDLRGLARDLGRLLGRSHGRPPTPGGRPGHQVIAEAARDARGLAYETVQVTEASAEQVAGDLALLRGLLAERGPLLGHDRPPP